jgi:hypothetical protein
MICFIVGCEPGNAQAQKQFLRMLDECTEYDGLVQIMLNENQPWKALLCFKDQETAQTAQWMMDMRGMQRREGNGTEQQTTLKDMYDPEEDKAIDAAWETERIVFNPNDPIHQFLKKWGERTPEPEGKQVEFMREIEIPERREGRGEDAESDGDIETDGYQHPGSAGTDGGNAGVCGYRQREEQDAAGAGKRSGSLAEQQDCDDHQDKGKDGTQTRRETAGSVRKDAENGDRG